MLAVERVSQPARGRIDSSSNTEYFVPNQDQHTQKDPRHTNTSWIPEQGTPPGRLPLFLQTVFPKLFLAPRQESLSNPCQPQGRTPASPRSRAPTPAFFPTLRANDMWKGALVNGARRTWLITSRQRPPMPLVQNHWCACWIWVRCSLGALLAPQVLGTTLCSLYKHELPHTRSILSTLP